MTPSVCGVSHSPPTGDSSTYSFRALILSTFRLVRKTIPRPLNYELSRRYQRVQRVGQASAECQGGGVAARARSQPLHQRRDDRRIETRNRAASGRKTAKGTHRLAWTHHLLDERSHPQLQHGDGPCLGTVEGHMGPVRLGCSRAGWTNRGDRPSPWLRGGHAQHVRFRRDVDPGFQPFRGNSAPLTTPADT